MNENKNINTAMVALAAMAIVVTVFFGGSRQSEDDRTGGGGISVQDCKVATSTQLVVGKDIPTFLAATSSRRSNFTVQGQNGATSTLALAFNGAVATTGTNFLQPRFSVLVNANSATGTTSPLWSAGLDTDFPYTGAISAISLQGTSTVLVTECIYN